MQLNREDLTHCHKVLSSDIKECEIFMGASKDGASQNGYQKRIEDDKRVIARIERILGEHLEWR